MRHPAISSRFFATLLLLLALVALLGPRAIAQEEAADPNVVVDPALFQAMDYRLVGPFRGGRSTAVTGVPGQRFTFYMGTTGGGVWKTEDAGESWHNVTDGHVGVGSIGAVAVAPSDPNVVYVGTGSACPRGNVSAGDGIYRSTDAGDSWTHIGLPEAGQIGRVQVHPTDPDIVYVAVLGHIFGPNEERGVYRSRDGGASWERVLYVSERTGAVDLAMNPANPRILFAAMWTAERKPWTLIDGSEESGLYRSTDGGDSWERLEGGLPEEGTPLGRIGVTVSPASPDRVWALVTAEGDDGGVYRSDDGGDSWSRISGYRELRTRGWYYSHIAADPTDENTVYTMNAGFFRSVDGGVDWERVSVPHGDNHDMWIDPDDPDVFIEANDGGAAITFNGGRTWSTQLNQPTAEFYRVTVDNQFPYRLYGAQQDNSTISVPAWSSGGISPKQFWYAVGGGESGHIAVDPTNPDIVFSGNYIGRIDRYDHLAQHSRNVVIYPQMQDGTAPKDLKYRFQWNAPIQFSIHEEGVVYHASNMLHRSADGGITWETISPDLTTDDVEQQEIPGGPIQHDHTGVEVYNTIFAFAQSPHAEGELWTGSDDGLVHLSRDDGATWTDVTPAEMPRQGTVNSIDVSAHRPGKATIAVFRYREDDFRPYVFQTTDWGESWTSLAGPDNGIPAGHFVRVVREDPDREGLLYAGTEFGMYVSFDDGAHWQSLQLDLPPTPITDLVVHEQDLVVATQGRSFWILDDVTPLHQVEAAAGTDAWLYEPRPAVRTIIGSFGFGGVQAPEYPPEGARIHYVLPEQIEGDVSLEILDAAGTVLRTLRPAEDEDARDGEDPTPFFRGRNRDIDLPAEPGMNRVFWDLKVEGPDVVEGARFSLAYTGGYRVVPGDYQVRLHVGDESQTRDLQVRVDPRFDVTRDDLQAQFDLMTRIKELLNSAHDAVRTIRSVRGQLGDLAGRLEEAGYEEDWRQRTEAIGDSLTAVEEEIIQTRHGASQDPINFPPKIDDQIAYLYSHVYEAYGRPTEGSYRRTEDLEAQLEPHLERLAEVLTGPLAQLNADLREADVPGIIVP